MSPEERAASHDSRSYGDHFGHGSHAHGRDHHAFDGDPNSLSGMIHRCGRALHHGEMRDPSDVLTAEEQATLQSLLQKLLTA